LSLQGHGFRRRQIPGMLNREFHIDQRLSRRSGPPNTWVPPSPAAGGLTVHAETHLHEHTSPTPRPGALRFNTALIETEGLLPLSSTWITHKRIRCSIMNGRQQATIPREAGANAKRLGHHGFLLPWEVIWRNVEIANCAGRAFHPHSIPSGERAQSLIAASWESGNISFQREKCSTSRC
jgi:hypothetical protein